MTTETRNAPTVQDPIVAAHLQAAAASLAAAEAAQAGDPDGATDPDDVAVSQHMATARQALASAAAAQTADGSWDMAVSGGAESVSNLGAPNVTDPDAASEYIGDGIRSKAPREITHRVEFRSVENPADDGLTLEGYAAVFGQPAEIDDQWGHYRETIERGAFAKTLSERKPVLLFDHGRHPMVGNMPIGTITALREDERGLFVRARLSDNWLTEPVRDAVRDKAITGMSVRMNVVKEGWSAGGDRTAQRSVKEVALIELGPVPFPAYEGTSVSTRSREVCTALSDPEVRSEVARIIASGTDLSAAERSEPTDTGHSFDQMRRRAKALLTLS